MKSTLADKLVASNSNEAKTYTPGVGMTRSPVSVEEWNKKKKDSERLKKYHFEQIGRRLQKILNDTRSARTVPKVVQTSLAEAIESYWLASKVRSNKVEANTQ